MTVSRHGSPPILAPDRTRERCPVRQARQTRTGGFCRWNTDGLKLDDVLSLEALMTLDDLEFHFLVFRQGLEALA